MSTRSKTSATIEPYLRLPEELSLILLTGTLACTPHWLTARLVHNILNEDTGNARGTTAVVFVSWARSLAFWKNEVRRTTSTDLTRYINNNRFAFVDFLTELPTTASERCIYTTESIIEATISKLGDRNTFIVLDSPDLLLSLALTTAPKMNNLVLRLRSKSSAMVLSCSGDEPFLAASKFSHPAEWRSPIEMESAAFVVQQAHSARLVLSVRGLDTGAARDVSGVLRVTRGGSWYDFTDGGCEKHEGNPTGGMEALYLVRRDGSVEISERQSTG